MNELEFTLTSCEYFIIIHYVPRSIVTIQRLNIRFKEIS